MTTINMHQAKTNLSKLVESIESGAQAEIILARNGKPVARIVPVASEAKAPRRLGLHNGKHPTFTLEEFNADDDVIAGMFADSPLMPLTGLPVGTIRSGKKPK